MHIRQDAQLEPCDFVAPATRHRRGQGDTKA